MSHNTINVGDKVRLPNGRVIQVVSITYGNGYPASTVTKVDQDTPLTSDQSPRAINDAIIWGT